VLQGRRRRLIPKLKDKRRNHEHSYIRTRGTDFVLYVDGRLHITATDLEGNSEEAKSLRAQYHARGRSPERERQRAHNRAKPTDRSQQDDGERETEPRNENNERTHTNIPGTDDTATGYGSTQTNDDVIPDTSTPGAITHILGNVEDANSKRGVDSDRLRITYLNVNGLGDHGDKLQDIVNTYNESDIILLAETCNASLQHNKTRHVGGTMNACE
jgi:hypothetical protein